MEHRPEGLCSVRPALRAGKRIHAVDAFTATNHPENGQTSDTGLKRLCSVRPALRAADWWKWRFRPLPCAGGASRPPIREAAFLLHRRGPSAWLSRSNGSSIRRHRNFDKPLILSLGRAFSGRRSGRTKHRASALCYHARVRRGLKGRPRTLQSQYASVSPLQIRPHCLFHQRA
jgi:hypothetical protein